jgi:TolA-binding protein
VQTTTKRPPANKPAFRFWFGIYGFTAFILAIAVAVFAWLASESRKENESGTANIRPTTNQALPEQQIQALARFEPPAYTPAPNDPRDFAQAMQPYSAGDYASAIPALRAAAAAHPDFVPARFYLGISLLLTKDRPAAIEQLQSVTAARNSPYAEQAHFYLAKAFIAQGNRSAAQQQLDLVIATAGPLESQARALLAQIR